MDYRPNTSPELINSLDNIFKAHKVKLLHDDKRGIDHGAWTILKMMYPNADVPIVQLSLHHSLDGELHYRIGTMLQPLREEGVLIIGSGSTMHNLRLLFTSDRNQQDHPMKKFEYWLQDTLTSEEHSKDRLARLLKFRSAPEFRLAHPREEHLIPLLVSAGAGNCSIAQLIHCNWKDPLFCLSFFQWN